MCCCFSHGIFVALRPKGSQSCSVNIYWLCQSNGNMVVKLHVVNRRHLSISCNIREVSKPKRLFFGDADRLTLRILQLFAQGQPIGQPGAREKCPCHLWGFSSVCIFSRPPQGFKISKSSRKQKLQRDTWQKWLSKQKNKKNDFKSWLLRLLLDTAARKRQELQSSLWILSCLKVSSNADQWPKNPKSVQGVNSMHEFPAVITPHSTAAHKKSGPLG